MLKFSTWNWWVYVYWNLYEGTTELCDLSTLVVFPCSAWRHQAITSTKIDLSLIWSSSIHLRTIPLKIFRISFTQWHLKIRHMKSGPHLPAANVLITIWLQRTGSSLVQVMACHLFGAKPSPEPMLNLCELDHEEKTSVKFEWTKQFWQRSIFWKYRQIFFSHFAQASMH